jgi:RNA polymerase sigma factor (sigma-70 family)
MAQPQDPDISKVVQQEQPRLRSFIRSRVRDPRDAEDILQDVLYELTQALQSMVPIDSITGWLFRVARNRIIDGFRKKKPQSLDAAAIAEGDDSLTLGDLLPSAEAGPEALYVRQALLAALEAAVDELPADQRDVFIAHEIEGRSFKDMAAEMGVSVNTLLSRKRYAVLRLREKLQEIHDELAEG